MWLPPQPLKELSKPAYKKRADAVRMRLLQLQHQLKDQAFPVLVVFGGVDGGGKHETVNLLNAWLDPRFVRTLAYNEPSAEEAERPRMWRFWRDLPVRGQIGLVLSGWYSQPLVDYARHRSDDVRFESQIAHIASFERMLSDDGALILKFWMHLSAEQQHQRLRQLAEDPLTIWQVKPQDWEHLHLYDRFIAASERVLNRTHARHAPWVAIDGSLPRLRALLVAESLAKALEKRLAKTPKPRLAKLKPIKKRPLGAVDLDTTLEKTEYAERLQRAQSRLIQLHQTSIQCQRSTILVFEGWDAAGKGGAIRRLVQPLDARQYKLIPIAAPTDEELARHYLWRFWRHLPRAGHLSIFDRSWYGRVLVERVEGFASPAQWQRAYEEINAFEASLNNAGIRVAKFWLHISPEEQLARFKARETDPFKSWKLTEEDWRNRHQWSAYEEAVNEMLARTHNQHAPWIVVPGNDKRTARIHILEETCRIMASQ